MTNRLLWPALPNVICQSKCQESNKQQQLGKATNLSKPCVVGCACMRENSYRARYFALRAAHITTEHQRGWLKKGQTTKISCALSHKTTVELYTRARVRVTMAIRASLWLFGFILLLQFICILFFIRAFRIRRILRNKPIFIVFSILKSILFAHPGTSCCRLYLLLLQ